VLSWLGAKERRARDGNRFPLRDAELIWHKKHFRVHILRVLSGNNFSLGRGVFLMKYESTKHALIHHPIHNIENPRKENKIFAKPLFSQGSSQEHEKSVPFGREEKSQKGLLRNNKLR
jgi:hypothetical protein